jgi:2-oxoglutarate dehydrogenase E2 component (dihydrolipoamide succinyltransferase)
VRSSPLVRKLASEHNVDLRHVPGSGGGGRITRDDILAFVERTKTAPAVAAPAAVSADAGKIAAAPAAAVPNKFAGTPGVVEPMSVMRKKIAEHMLASRTSIPCSTLT